MGESAQIALVEFREVDVSGRWSLEVLVDGTLSGSVHRVEGLYRYFEGPYNDITWSFADRDLERLKERIRLTSRRARSVP
jgi:hypothetical protein